MRDIKILSTSILVRFAGTQPSGSAYVVTLEALQANDAGAVPLTASVTAVVAAGIKAGARFVDAAPGAGSAIEKLTAAKPAGPAVGFAFTGATTAPAVGLAAVPPPPQADSNITQLAPRRSRARTMRAPVHTTMQAAFVRSTPPDLCAAE